MSWSYHCSAGGRAPERRRGHGVGRRVPRRQQVGILPRSQGEKSSLILSSGFNAHALLQVGMIDGYPWPVGVRLTHLNPSAASASASAASEAPAEVAEAEDGAGAATTTTPSSGGKAWSKRSSLFRPYNNLESVKR